MPRSLPYRRASGEPAAPRRGLTLRRWLLAALFLPALLLTVWAVAGKNAPAVFQTWAIAAFILPLLAAAAMLGIALTAPFAQAALFDDSPWPDLFRLLLSTALGLGALSLAMLLLGSLHLIEPGHAAATDNPLSPAGHPWIPALLLPLAAGIGFLPARNFLQSFNKNPLRQRISHPTEWLILLAAIPLALLLIAAAYPPGTLWISEARGYDVLEYHLELPREYAANNSTAPLAHNVYSYLPANVEMLYLLAMQLAKFAMRDPIGPASAGAYLWGVYPAQYLHVILTLLIAAVLALAPIRLSASARILALLVFLSIPWTLITGSLAYNEAGMLLFGTLALTLSLSSSPKDRLARPVLLGILLGLAVGCKLTAGLFFALPVAALLFLRPLLTPGTTPSIDHRKSKSKPPLRPLFLTSLTALLLYSPWAIRAAIYSGGNPLFPLASAFLPKNHWTLEQAQRFARAHSALQNQRPIPLLDLPTRAKALLTESALNPQWSPALASIDLWAGEKPDDSPWKHLGILWLIAPVAALLAFLASLRQKSSAALALLLIIALQLLAWTFLTHLQSRFLLPLAIPLSLLIALGSEGLGPAVGGLPLGVLKILITAAIIIQTLCSIFLLLPETDLLGGAVARALNPPRFQPIGKLFELEINYPAIYEDPASLLANTNQRPEGKILLVGAATPLFLEGQILYNTPFDDNPLADHLLTTSPAATVAWLQQQHIHYLLIDWSEITRLKSTYGYDDANAITPDSITSLTPFGPKPLPPPNHDPTLTLLQITPAIPTSRPASIHQ